jgi:hypothetical protein
MKRQLFLQFHIELMQDIKADLGVSITLIKAFKYILIIFEDLITVKKFITYNFVFIGASVYLRIKCIL